jgi:hypothetical protein
MVERIFVHTSSWYIFLKNSKYYPTITKWIVGCFASYLIQIGKYTIHFDAITYKEVSILDV